jgi:hypothetical protein
VKLKNEDGQVLILALGFLAFFGLVVGAVLMFADASVRSTQRLEEQRSVAYAGDGVVDAAIQLGRIDNTLGAFGDGRCQGGGVVAPTPVLLSSTSPNPEPTQADVRCVWSPDFRQPDRTVIFTSYLHDTMSPLVQVTVVYYDSQGSYPPIDIKSWTYCAHDDKTCS